MVNQSNPEQNGISIQPQDHQFENLDFEEEVDTKGKFIYKIDLTENEFANLNNIENEEPQKLRKDFLY